MGLHSALDTANIHQLQNWEFATLDAAQAETFNAADIGKVLRITDSDDYYILKDTTPTFLACGNEILCEVQTTDATETALLTFGTATDYNYQVFANVLAGVDTGGNVAGYVRIATFKNDSGTLSIVGSTSTTHTAENDAAWDCQIEASGTNILVDVTGAAGTTINWLGFVRIYVQKNS